MLGKGISIDLRQRRSGWVKRGLVLQYYSGTSMEGIEFEISIVKGKHCWRNEEAAVSEV